MKPALVQIKSAADRAAHLSSQLLGLARSESASLSSKEFKKINLTKLAMECSMEWVPKALESDMDLGFDAPSYPQYISGYATLLWELLSNLIHNSICYGKSGGEINVIIQSNTQVIIQSNTQILLIVEDDGTGIQLAETNKVFERFYRIPGSPGDGCGLGLSKVKEIAILHGASISIGLGSLGQGTRIVIAFERCLD